MSDFSDRRFVAGSLFGLRAFGVDHTGRLHGPSLDTVFRPGENVAICRKSEFNSITFGPIWATSTASWTLSSGSAFIADPDPVDPEPPIAKAAVETIKKPEHSLAGLLCSCGFYAYFDGRNDYKKPTNIAAIVGGYGVCTVGSRGFRAEKARLVAVVAPGRKFPEARFQLVLRNYPDVPIYASRAAALEAHPLTPPEVPGPDSPGFWDRPVKA